MRIAIDAHSLGRKQTGNEAYVRNLLREFAVFSAHEFVAYIAEGAEEKNLPRNILKRRVSDNPWIRLGFELSSVAGRDEPDLLHVQYTAPLISRVPTVVTLHDVSYLEHPEYFSLPRRMQLRSTVARSLRSAARVIVPSRFSYDRVLAHYAIPEERVTVIYNGVDPRFRPLRREAAAAVVEERLGFSAPYILTVGDLQVRKNQVRLIHAFRDLVRSRPDLPHHLVLAGKAARGALDVQEAARQSGVHDRIHFTGFASDEDITHLYAGCDVFVFPSLYEGFGLPVLEAMASGRAVACSNTSATPEVADSAALLFDPYSVPEISRAMLDLLVHPELRGRMERLGAQRAARFSWRSAAEQTIAIYESVAGRRPTPMVAKVGT